MAKKSKEYVMLKHSGRIVRVYSARGPFLITEGINYPTRAKWTVTHRATTAACGSYKTRTGAERAMAYLCRYHGELFTFKSYGAWDNRKRANRAKVRLIGARLRQMGAIGILQ